VSVGASTKLPEAVASFTNRAPMLNLLAPGASILSSVPGGSYQRFSGTSMATPHVAGAFALLKQKRPAATVDRVLAALTSTGLLLPDPFVGPKPRISLSSSVPLFAAVRHDFDGDGKADILWRNSSTGQNYLYPMNGKTILGSEGFLRTVADSNWQVVGTGDFDGDLEADILWRHAATGENYIYFMAGKTIKSEGYIRTVADPKWQVAGIGDFDGDGKDDILWHNAVTGESYIYFMDGKTIKPIEGFLRTVADLNWQIVGVGDFDGDGKSDILWRNRATGENYLYPMNGLAIKPSEGFLRTVADQNWTIAGVGDFDGDGKSDIVWRNSSSGQNYIWPMNGTAIKPTEGYIRTVADLAWRIVAIGDYDGDGKSDLLWRNSSSGETYLYPMDGTTIKPSEGFVRTVADIHWQVQKP
jgi:hypothetical protein